MTTEKAPDTALRPGQSQFTGRQGASVFIFISADDGKGFKSRYIIITIYAVKSIDVAWLQPEREPEIQSICL